MDSKWLQILTLLVLLVFAVVGLFLLTLPVEEMKEPPKYMVNNLVFGILFIYTLEYGIVMDAGSSHTSLYIYKWLADKQNGTGVVTQHSECHVKGGGISSYAGQQGAAGHSLEACLKQAVQDIPRTRHHLTPVYLGATAGMRLLNISSPEMSKQVLQDVENTIKSFPFSFRGATILSGQQEGAYGWVTVNYLLENFIKYGFVGRWLNPGRRTVGALDLGGASTQITFVTPEKVEDEKNRMTLRLYGQDYHLYTHSYLCYGKQEFLRRLLALLITSQGVTDTVYHPCYPSDHNETLELHQVFESPCTISQRPASYEPQAMVTIQGTGDYHLCVSNISEIFLWQDCPFSQCAFDRVFQPNISGSFTAFSVFFFTFSFLQRSLGITVRTPELLQWAARSLCNMTIDEMSNRVEDERSYLKEYCAVTVYIQVLMLRGYHFDEHSFSGVTFQKKAGGASVGWALGYMLSLSNQLPEEHVRMRKGMHTAAWVVLLILQSCLMVITLIFMNYHCRKRSNI